MTWGNKAILEKLTKGLLEHKNDLSHHDSKSMQFCDIFIWMAPQIHYVSFLEFYNLHYKTLNGKIALKNDLEMLC